VWPSLEIPPAVACLEPVTVCSFAHKLLRRILLLSYPLMYCDYEMNTVTCRPIAKQQLCNPATVQTAVAREQFCGHVVSLATRHHTIMEETFSVLCVPGLYNEDYHFGEFHVREDVIRTITAGVQLKIMSGRGSQGV
jgi:hypothetical protein